MRDWLIRKDMELHSGGTSEWKIECDGLTEEEIDTFAVLISNRFKFGSVMGVPRGGWRIANALQKYCSGWYNNRLIVDDVLTSGASMEQYRESELDIGVVLFARGPCPLWVHPVFQFWNAGGEG